MCKMVIANVLVVLNGYDRAKAAAIQNLLNFPKEKGVPKHMTYRNHLLREGF